MIVGIVGSEQAKFTPETEAEARRVIRGLLQDPEVTCVCSGECHLGGVDVFAREEAEAMGIPFVGFAPAVLSWAAGYKPRNIEIATLADEVYCITVRRLPIDFSGRTFSRCYHCRTHEHVKSGGCWTAKYARKLGKKGETLVVGL